MSTTDHAQDSKRFPKAFRSVLKTCVVSLRNHQYHKNLKSPSSGSMIRESQNRNFLRENVQVFDMKNF